MENKNTKLIALALAVVGLVVGIYMLKNDTKIESDSSSTDSSTSTYPVPMGATNAPDPTVLERVARQKIDVLLKDLKPGQTSDQVLELQTELQKLGYIVKSWKPTKFYGTVTTNAVNKYMASKK